MSNPNFVSDLVAMAKAFEELPTVKMELEHVKHENATLYEAITNREESILRIKAEIDALHAKVRDTEAQRDDAELRFLDGEDRTRSALDFIKSTFGSAGSLIQALEPPAKDEPVAAPPAEQEQHYEPMPMPMDASPIPVEQSPYYPQGEGVAAAHVDPTNANTETEGLSGSASSTVTQEASAAGPDDIGYHNEPSIADGDWQEWNTWCTKMTTRFGNHWPDRPAVA